MAKVTPLILRKARVRKALAERLNGRPRLSVHRSSKNIYAQIIDDAKGVTIARGLCDQPYGCRDFDVEDCNGYRLCFGHDTASR